MNYPAPKKVILYIVILIVITSNSACNHPPANQPNQITREPSITSPSTISTIPTPSMTMQTAERNRGFVSYYSDLDPGQYILFDEAQTGYIYALSPNGKNQNPLIEEIGVIPSQNGTFATRIEGKTIAIFDLLNQETRKVALVDDCYFPESISSNGELTRVNTYS